MAQLKDSVVQGSLRVTDSIYGTWKGNTIDIQHGGTGVTEFSANSLIMSGTTTTSALTTRSITDYIPDGGTPDALAGKTSWGSGDNTIPTINTIAYWDGRYKSNDNKSNLLYCSVGQFRDMATKTKGNGFSESDNTISVAYGTAANTAVQGNATLVTLNGTNKTAGSIASFYAPTGAGTSGQYLKSSGSGAPTWATFTTSTVGLGNVSNNANLNGATGTKGDMIYWSGTNTPARLGIGTAGYLLQATTNGPSWIQATNTVVNSTIVKRDANGNFVVNAMLGTNGTSGTYGTTLPTGTIAAGRIFFQISEPFYELPAGGTTGQALIKRSNSHRDVEWGNVGGIMRPDDTSKFYLTGSSLTTENADPALFSTSVYVENAKLFGTMWNDYAEFRETKEQIEPGRCIVENGDGTLSLSTARLQGGAEIVSDTYGLAIGKTDICNTPIAVSGRVLTYLNESIDEIKIGAPVCSGPNGTVSQMTEEEARLYPWLIIGTISAIPKEEVWGEGKVQVKNRIWVRVR